MKLLWRFFIDLKSNKFSTLLIIIEMIFSVICYQLCFVLTESFIKSSSFFRTNYNENSIKVFADELSDEQIGEITSGANAEEWFYSRFYYSESENGLFINSASEQAFNIAKQFCIGGYADISKDYGNAVPCVTSSAMSSAYDIGKTYTIDGVDYYICGHLINNNIFYMGNTAVGSAFIMAYDKNDVISQSASKPVNTCLFIKTDSDSIDKTTSALESIGKFDFINGSTVFNWKSDLRKEFQTVSGILIIGIWIAIISVIGILANNYLTYVKNEKNYSCQMCIGAKRRDIIILYVIRLDLAVIIAIILSAIISKPILAYMGIENNSHISIIIAAATVIMISSLSLITVFRHLKKVRLY